MQTVASISNMILENSEYITINKFFTLRNSKNHHKLLIDYDSPVDGEDFVESYQRYFRRSMELSLPRVVISPCCLIDEGNNKLFWERSVFVSYYGKNNYSNEKIYKISSDDISNLKAWHNRLIQYHKKYAELNESPYFYWDIAYNEYINGLNCSYLEEAFVHLVTALEALTIKGDGKIKYRTSLYTSILYTDNKETQHEIFDFIKKMYNLRSKVVHGDDIALKEEFKSNDLYDDMIKLREIVSKLLSITYFKDKDKVLKEIQILTS